MTETRSRFGAISRRNCRRLAARSDETKVTPVMFPPGRARLATNPVCTGSRLTTMTIGMLHHFFDGTLKPICAARCLESGVEALVPAIDACHSPIEGGDGIGA